MQKAWLDSQRLTQGSRPWFENQYRARTGEQVGRINTDFSWLSSPSFNQPILSP